MAMQASAAQAVTAAPSGAPVSAADLARVPVLMLGDLFVATTSALDPTRLDTEETAAQFLDGCRLGPPGSATLFTSKKAAEMAGSKIKLPQFARDALKAVQAEGKDVAAARKEVAPWRIQRVPLEVGFKLLQGSPKSCRLAVPAEDVAVSVMATQPPKPPPGLPKKDAPPAEAPQPKGRIPIFRLPGLTLRIRLPEEGSPLLVLSPVFLSPRSLQTAVQLAVVGRQEMWKQVQRVKRRWIDEAVDRLERDIRSVQGWVEHKVEEGESLADVAERFRTTPARLLQVNGLPEATPQRGVLPAGASLQVLPDPDGESRGVGAAIQAGLLGAQRGALLKLSDAHTSFDSWLVTSSWGTNMLKLPGRIGMRAGFLEDHLQQLAALNNAAAASRTADGKVPDTSKIQDNLAAGMSTFLATAYLFGGQELVGRGGAQLVQPEAPAPPAPAALPATSQPAPSSSKPSKSSTPAATTPTADQQQQQQQEATPKPRPLLVMDPQATGPKLAASLAGAAQVGAVVASHMAAVSSMPLTPEIQQQKLVIGAMLKQQLGLQKAHFELEGVGMHFDADALQGKKPDDFLAPARLAPGAPPIVRGLFVIGDTGLEELGAAGGGIPLPSVQHGSLEGVQELAVASSRLAPKAPAVTDAVGARPGLAAARG